MKKICIKKILKFSAVISALILGTLFSSISSKTAFASVANPTYRIHWDEPDTGKNAKDAIFPLNDCNGGLYNLKIYFENQTKVLPKQDYKFLMLNGQLIPGTGVVTKDTVYYVPVKVLVSNSSVLKWDKKKKVLTQVINKKVTSSKAVMINNKYYVPLGFLSNYNFDIFTYTDAPFDILPVITIDTDYTEIASAKDINSIKQKLISTLDQTKKKLPKEVSDDGYHDVKKELQKLKYTGNLSRYWVLQDSDYTGFGYLVDSKTKNIFLFRYNSFMFGLEALSVDAFYLMNFTG